jgi:hypothetical protein
MSTNVAKALFKEELLNLKTISERISACEEQGMVYLGKGFAISKEDYNRVIIADQAIKYGDGLDED